jgi:hypothetical protein
MANLSYIKNFHFCNSTKEELSYCLTSFEAAVEFIRQGNFGLSQGRVVSTVQYSSTQGVFYMTLVLACLAWLSIVKGALYTTSTYVVVADILSNHIVDLDQLITAIPVIAGHNND